MTLNVHMDFERGSKGKLLISYVAWISLTVLCCALVFMFSNANSGIPAEVYSKVIKLVSYGLIMLTVLDAHKDLGSAGPNVKLRENLYRVTGFLTFIIAFFLFGQIILFVFGYENYKISVYYDNLIALLPIMILAAVNLHLAKKEEDDVSRAHRRFFYLVDLPCLTAAGTLFGLTYAASTYEAIDSDEVNGLLSGAMAFLVFMAYVTDKMLHHYKPVGFGDNGNKPI